ncbi:hypothetical protein GUITHDRAFT_134888 [Guillardia theta CCMP2712]|uniref:Uncharacterized protein n=1 Tax=Guillardia theta (strain CCMP2712) TaxID=905079 RepID=L1JR78_GUITC|nr:hypothetical protein GUITHDRAFT_134888 [Guillardia theta CCMP2712]EKX50769.1 hypothetical protein GUITHDRAFT_134888 [Guillardia theta CCMP2712]|eukprot:XP_005837749.1 hypothetical protein GUITHDRAFT_134888 [Guillardia theta CCMP2712]
MSMESITKNAIDALQRLERCEKKERFDLNLPTDNPRLKRVVYERNEGDEDAVRLLKDYLRSADLQSQGSKAMIELVQDVLQAGPGLSLAGSRRKTKSSESSTGVEVARTFPSSLAPSCSGIMDNAHVRLDGHDESRVIVNRIVAKGEKVEQALLAGLSGMTPGSAQYIALKEKAAARKLKAILRATEEAIAEKCSSLQEHVKMTSFLKSRVREYQGTILASVPDIRMAADAWIQNVESLRRERDRMRHEHTKGRSELEQKVIELQEKLERTDKQAQEELKRNESFAKNLASSALRQKELSQELEKSQCELRETRQDKERLSQLVDRLSSECEEERGRADSFSEALDRLRGILNRMRGDIVEQREADTSLRVLVSWLRFASHSKSSRHAQQVLDMEEEGRRLLSEEKTMFMRTLEEERTRLQDEIKGLNQVLKHEREERLQEWEEVSKRRAAEAAAREEDRRQREEDKTFIAELQLQVRSLQQDLNAKAHVSQQSLLASDKVLHHQSTMASKISMIERLVASLESSIRKLEEPPRQSALPCKMVEDVSWRALSLSQETRSLLEERDAFAKEILSPPCAADRSTRVSPMPHATRVQGRRDEGGRCREAEAEAEAVVEHCCDSKHFEANSERSRHVRDLGKTRQRVQSPVEARPASPPSPRTQRCKQEQRKELRFNVRPGYVEDGAEERTLALIEVEAQERFLEMALEKARKRASLIEHMIDQH